ncbi:MAG: hypothetical protein AAGC92_12565 [Pseudomonadota bacterium]
MTMIDAADPHAYQLEITLAAEQRGSEFVRSLSVRGAPARLRVTFSEHLAIESVFEREAAREIAAMCRELAPSEGIVGLPDARISLRGVVICGCTILVRRARDGVRHVIIRCGRLIGNALALMRRDVLPADSIELRVEELSSIAVEKLFLPLANLDHLLGEMQRCPREGAELAAALERLRGHTAALNASLSMLISGEDMRGWQLGGQKAVAREA